MIHDFMTDIGFPAIFFMIPVGRQLSIVLFLRPRYVERGLVLGMTASGSCVLIKEE